MKIIWEIKKFHIKKLKDLEKNDLKKDLPAAEDASFWTSSATCWLLF